MSMLYTDQEKRIYGPYDDGSGQVVFGDPHKINRTLTYLLDGNPNKVVADYNSDDVAAKFEAANRLVEAAIQAFDLKPFDKTNGSGLDEEAVLKIIIQFSKWMKELKKKDEPTPTGSSASDGPPVTPEIPNPGKPKPTPSSEKAFLDQRQKDHEAMKKRMGPLTRTGLPSG